MAKGHLSAKVMKTLENMRQNEPRLEEEDVKALHDAVRGGKATAALCWHDCVCVCGVCVWVCGGGVSRLPGRTTRTAHLLTPHPCPRPALSFNYAMLFAI